MARQNKPYKKRYNKNYRKKSYQRKRRNEFNTELVIIPLVLFFLVLLVSIYSDNITNAAVLVYQALFILVPLVLIVAIAFGIIHRKKQKKEYASQQSLEQLRHMDPFEFEKYVAWVYKQLGYRSKVTKEQGDHGLDVIAEKDGKKFAIQVKRYSKRNAVGEPEVRNLLGSAATGEFYGAIFVTTSSFTVPATAWAKKNGVQLVDGRTLIAMVHHISKEKNI